MKQRLAFIDALRGLAVAGVIVVHCSILIPTPSATVNRLLAGGALGVQLFFVASAFTLCVSADARCAERRPTVNFFVRRLCRIVPMFYCAAAFYLWLWGLGGNHPFYAGFSRLTPARVASGMTFVNGWSPQFMNRVVPGGWSVVVEVYFYALFPFLFRRIRSVSAAWALVLAFTVAAAPLHWLLIRHASARPDVDRWFEFSEHWLPAQLPVFGLGILLYFSLRSSAGNDRPPIGSLLLFTAAVVLCACPFIEAVPFLPRAVLAGLGFACLAAGLSMKQTPLFVNRITCGLGKISYSAYLSHFAFLVPCRSLAARVDRGHHPAVELGGMLLLVFVATVVTSVLTYRLVELPGIAIGKWIIGRLERRPGVHTITIGAETAVSQTW